MLFGTVFTKEANLDFEAKLFVFVIECTSCNNLYRMFRILFYITFNLLKCNIAKSENKIVKRQLV